MDGKIRLKRIQAEELAPILIVTLFNKNNKSVMIRALADSGAAKSLVAIEFIGNLPIEKTKKTSWLTVAGKFQTNRKTPAMFKLAELNPTAEKEHKFHVTSTLGRYDMIISRDLLKTMGLIIDFRKKITWGKYHINMKPTNVSVNNSYSIDDPRGVNKLVGWMAKDNCKKS